MKFEIELPQEAYLSFRETMKRVAYLPDNILSPKDSDTAQEVLKQLAKYDPEIVKGDFGYTFYKGSHQSKKNDYGSQ